MTKRILGYARVSTVSQNTQIQYEQLMAFGVDKVYTEKMSGTSTAKRTVLADLLSTCKKGDHLIVTKIDRLARSIMDLNRIVSDLHSKGVSVTFIEDRMSFEAGAKPSSINLLMLNILGAFAQFERDLIIERTSAGIERAIQAGKHIGRPIHASENIERAIELYSSRQSNQLSINDILQLTGLKKAKFYYHLRKHVDSQLLGKESTRKDRQ